MKKECNITRDLLPLYIEELCSEDSREYVEEHLKQCSECMSSYEYLKYTDLCVSATEKREINGFKKLEKNIFGKIYFNYFLFLVAIVIIIGILMLTTNRSYYWVYCLLMPLLMLATGFTFQNGSCEQRSGKHWKLWLIVQALLLLISTTAIFYLMYAFKYAYPFRLPPAMIGPIMDTTYKINICVSLVCVVSHLYQVGRKKVRYSAWCNFAFLCIFMNLTYDATLYTMESFEGVLESLITKTWILLGINIVVTVVIWMGMKRKKKMFETDVNIM